MQEVLSALLQRNGIRRNQENNPEDYSLDKQPTDTQTNLNIKETTTSEIGSNEPEVEEKTVENQPKETIIECHNTEEIKTTELIWLSERIAYNYESKSQQILEAYIFGNNQSKAERWARFLAETTTIANQATTEKNTINDQFKYQITLEGIQLADLQKLTEINLNTNHPYSVWGDAPIRPIEPACKPSNWWKFQLTADLKTIKEFEAWETAKEEFYQLVNQGDKRQVVLADSNHKILLFWKQGLPTEISPECTQYESGETDLEPEDLVADIDAEVKPDSNSWITLNNDTYR